MTTIPVERELLERVLPYLSNTPDLVQIGAETLGDEIRALLSEQPQADHSAQDLNMVEQPQAGAGPALIGTLRKSFPLLEEEGLDEFVHCCECHIQRERKRLHAIIDAALTQSPKGEEE